MDSAGAHAGHTNSLFVLFLWVTGLAFVLVLAFLLAALLRRRGMRGDGVEEGDAPAEGGLTRGLIGWVGFILLGLVVLTLASYFTDRRLDLLSPETGGPSRVPIRIRITAQQWWWQVEYQDPDPSKIIRTANELHLPVGVPVHIELQSQDVIHSFWVPNLAGKQDMIPGRIEDIRLLPTRIGQYRGQCAEFCGLQHARMAFDVTVEPRAAYEAWRARSLQPAPAPATPLQQAGYAYFMSHQCVSCHAILGTPANGNVGPDLSRVASRRTLGAGTLHFSRGNLEGWIANPQGVKPGNRMPQIIIPPNDLLALTAYLESLT